MNDVEGDIGYKPEQVERKLEDLFFLANRWGCVLLLDEADVFLAKRKVSPESSNTYMRSDFIANTQGSQMI